MDSEFYDMDTETPVYVRATPDHAWVGTGRKGEQVLVTMQPCTDPPQYLRDVAEKAAAILASVNCPVGPAMFYDATSRPGMYEAFVEFEVQLHDWGSAGLYRGYDALDEADGLNVSRNGGRCLTVWVWPENRSESTQERI
jgi:hypothetical protein